MPSVSLLLNQFFHPDSAATAQYLGDLADHTLTPPTVICGSPTYSKNSTTTTTTAKVIRTPTLPFSRTTRLTRTASYASYILFATWHALTKPTPEVVVTLTTPPLLSLLGNLLKVRGARRHVIWEMDVYPCVAVNLGVLSPTSPITRLIRALAIWSRRRADAIIALGPDMRDHLISLGIPADKIHICENWASSDEIYPLPFPDPAGPLHIHYSGNLGLAHDLPTIRETIYTLRDDPSFHFTFAGGGAYKAELLSFAQQHNLKNVTFTGYSDRHDLARSLAQGHVGLVTQKPESLGLVVPSKSYGILAAGRPLLYIGPQEATPARIIDQYHCGWQIDPGDTQGLIDLLHTLHQQRHLLYTAGQKARQAFETQYDRPQGVARILEVLQVPARPKNPETTGVLDKQISNAEQREK